MLRPGERSPVQFAAEYRPLRELGLKHSQIAELMGYRPNTVHRKVSLCRAAGLLPRATQRGPRVNMSPPCDCARCHQRLPHRARGLCDGCYVLEYLAGNLADWPRRTHSLADVVEDFLTLWGRGMSLQAIAEKIGYPTVRRLGVALDRACRKGLMDRSKMPPGVLGREPGGRHGHS